MNNRIIRNNIFRNKAVSFTVTLFIAAAAMLISLSAILSVTLSGAVGRLMREAKTPHFMQMHSGELSLSELTAFAEENSSVSDFQVLEFLNIDSSQIRLGSHSLIDSVQDNGFCIQNDRFDILLDLNDEPIRPGSGELYVPVCYFKDGTVKLGDEAVVSGKTFVVAGFVRDSQMNSALASSKRFVVSGEDWHMLQPYGSVEYLIEFRLYDRSELGAFETAYSEAKLPANGPAITWPLFQMISSVSDGIMIAVILLIGALVIVIALLCVRFTLLAKMEDDYREIGVMKAIGMRDADIRSIYLSIYAVLAAVGSAAGFFLSLLIQKPMLKSIRMNLGGGGSTTAALIFGAGGAALVFLCIVLYIRHNLRRFRRISAVQALRFGAEQDSDNSHKAFKLSGCRIGSVNFLLAIKDVLTRKRLYLTMLTVVMLASFIIIVPQNLYHTISGDDFVTYMGAGGCDLRLDIQQTGEIDEKTAEIGGDMSSDPDIAGYALFTTKTFTVKMQNGTTETIKIELGDHTVFPLQYAEGRMPVTEHEIALSAMNAEELGRNVGEVLTIITEEGEKQLTICGIYSDITNGGKTAKASFTAESDETAWGMVCADLADPEQAAGKIVWYAKRFPYAKISAIDEYLSQTFGQTLQAVRTASEIAVLAAAAVTLLVTLLFMKLLAAKDRYSIAVLRAVGFTGSDIRRQYAWRAAMILTAGIILGTILAGTLGEKLAGMAISSFGAASFHFTINPVFTFLLSPLILFSAALAATVWGTFRAGEVSVGESIKE